MKKVFAALAAAAMALTMCAFTGCGDDDKTKGDDKKPDITNPDDTNKGDGNGEGKDDLIEGNYEELTAEQLVILLQSIDPEKFFGDTIGIGLKAGLEATTVASFADIGEVANVSGSLDLNYKLSVSESGVGGYGTAAVKYDYESDDPDQADFVMSLDLLGTLYHDSEIVYASLAGVQEEDMKVKINLPQLLDGLASLLPGDEEPGISVSPATYSAAEDENVTEDGGLNFVTILGMASQLGVEVYADTTDGVKLKVSITEDTVWGVAGLILAENGDEEALAEIQEAVTVNNFQFDLYFALDKDGAFAGAGLAVDIDVEVSGSLFDEIFETSAGENPNLAVCVKGSVEVYTHDDTVTVPDTLATDESYWDATDTVIEYLGYLFGGEHNDYPSFEFPEESTENGDNN